MDAWVGSAFGTGAVAGVRTGRNRAATLPLSLRRSPCCATFGSRRAACPELALFPVLLATTKRAQLNAPRARAM